MVGALRPEMKGEPRKFFFNGGGGDTVGHRFRADDYGNTVGAANAIVTVTASIMAALAVCLHCRPCSPEAHALGHNSVRRIEEPRRRLHAATDSALVLYRRRDRSSPSWRPTRSSTRTRRASAAWSRTPMTGCPLGSSTRGWSSGYGSRQDPKSRRALRADYGEARTLLLLNQEEFYPEAFTPGE